MVTVGCDGTLARGSMRTMKSDRCIWCGEAVGVEYATNFYCQKCSDSVGPLCNSVCPNEFSNQGLACRKGSTACSVCGRERTISRKELRTLAVTQGCMINFYRDSKNVTGTVDCPKVKKKIIKISVNDKGEGILKSLNGRSKIKLSKTTEDFRQGNIY